MPDRRTHETDSAANHLDWDKACVIVIVDRCLNPPGLLHEEDEDPGSFTTFPIAWTVYNYNVSEEVLLISPPRVHIHTLEMKPSFSNQHEEIEEGLPYTFTSCASGPIGIYEGSVTSRQ